MNCLWHKLASPWIDCRRELHLGALWIDQKPALKNAKNLKKLCFSKGNWKSNGNFAVAFSVILTASVILPYGSYICLSASDIAHFVCSCGYLKINFSPSVPTSEFIWSQSNIRYKSKFAFIWQRRSSAPCRGFVVHIERHLPSSPFSESHSNRRSRLSVSERTQPSITRFARLNK